MPWRLVMHVVANVDLLEVRDELQDLAIDARGQAIHARILSFDPFFSTHTHTHTHTHLWKWPSIQPGPNLG